MRIVATDADPVAVEQERLLCAGQPNVTVVDADLDRPDHLLDQARQVLTLRPPLLVLCLGVLHHLPDQAARTLLATSPTICRRGAARRVAPCPR